MSHFEAFKEVMARLRAEDGCPWDKEQTHETLKAYLIEEAYEVIEAIDQADDEALKEELGDLMLQIVFHARIAEEEGRFDIEGVLETSIDKLTRRHPHVFGELEVNGSGEVLANWEKIKKAERKAKQKDSVLDGVPEHLPALLKARRVQEKVARVGFDWDNIEGMLDKVEEELGEFRQAYAQQDSSKVEEELGDVLFSLVNVARFVEACPEDALRKTISKFMTRFRYIESVLDQQGIDLKRATFEEMDALWEEAKAQKRSGIPRQTEKNRQPGNNTLDEA